MPGMTLTQWITGRLMAQGVRGLVTVGRSLFGAGSGPARASAHTASNEEHEVSPAETYAMSVKTHYTVSQGRIAGHSEHSIVKQ